MKNIKWENAEHTQCSAEIYGTMWSGITEKSRFWDSVQDAINDGAEVAPYVEPELPNTALAELAQLDKDIDRFSEDLFDALKAKGILTDEDLPVHAVEKVNRKKQLRADL